MHCLGLTIFHQIATVSSFSFQENSDVCNPLARLTPDCGREAHYGEEDFILRAILPVYKLAKDSVMLYGNNGKTTGCFGLLLKLNMRFQSHWC